MRASGQTVLITGSNGFTGHHLRTTLLGAGYRCVGLVRSDGAGDGSPVDISDVAALRDAIEVTRPDFVIHLAAIAYVGHSDPVEFYRVNLFGTLNLLQAIHDSGVKPEKVLLASSANVYGAHPICPVGEDFPPAPVNHYAMSKLAMEIMARTWMDRLPIVIARPFNYTGPGQSRNFVIPKIVSHFQEKRPVIQLGNIDVRREFNDVRFVTTAYSKLIEKASAGSLVNICTGVGYSIADVLKTLEDLTSHHIEVQVDPSLVRDNELRVLVGDPTLLNRKVGELPKYSLRETLESMLHQT